MLEKKIPMARRIESIVNTPIYLSYYLRKIKKSGLSPNDVLILGTVARSGTHYMMILLANYIAYTMNKDEGFDPMEMNRIFPNNWHLSYIDYHKLPFGKFYKGEITMPNKIIRNIGIGDLTRSHSVFQRLFWKKSKILHLYRNPLDYSVSLYNYKHKKRESNPDRKSSPHEVLLDKFDNYIEMYKSYVEAAKSGKYYVLRVAYEQLIREPDFYLKSILTWLGLEPDEKGLKFAVEMSSIKKTKESELKGAVINPTAEGLKGSFISSGQVGQWKKYFSDDELNYWRERFDEEGVPLDNFILE